MTKKDFLFQNFRFRNVLKTIQEAQLFSTKHQQKIEAKDVENRLKQIVAYIWLNVLTLGVDLCFL